MARLCDGVGSAARPRAASRAGPVPSGAAQTAVLRRRLRRLAEAPPAPTALQITTHALMICVGVAARGRAESPTKAGGNYEDLQELAGSE